MKKCKNIKCQADNPDDAKYCHMCGQKLSKKTGIRITGIIIAIIIFILGMSGSINPFVSVIICIIIASGGYILQDILNEQS